MPKKCKFALFEALFLIKKYKGTAILTKSASKSAATLFGQNCSSFALFDQKSASKSTQNRFEAILLQLEAELDASRRVPLRGAKAPLEARHAALLQRRASQFQRVAETEAWSGKSKICPRRLKAPDYHPSRAGLGIGSVVH